MRIQFKVAGCRKISYPNSDLAKAAARGFQKRKGMTGPLNYVYYCENCEHFHLTSMSKDDKAAMDKRAEERRLKIKGISNQVSRAHSGAKPKRYKNFGKKPYQEPPVSGMGKRKAKKIAAKFRILQEVEFWDKRFNNEKSIHNPVRMGRMSKLIVPFKTDPRRKKEKFCA